MVTQGRGCTFSRKLHSPAMKQQPGSDISSLQTRDKLQQRDFTPRKYASLESVWKDRPRAVPHTVNSRTWVTGRKTKGSLASPSVYRRRRGHQFPGACRLRHCHPPSIRQPVASTSLAPALLGPAPWGQAPSLGGCPSAAGSSGPGRAGPGPKVSPRRAPLARPCRAPALPTRLLRGRAAHGGGSRSSRRLWGARAAAAPTARTAPAPAPEGRAAGAALSSSPRRPALRPRREMLKAP